jgi:CheY-like chemotaxis protein
VQVLSNLLHNATKFTPAGGSIVVSADVQPGTPAPVVSLAVRDTGIGIPAATLPKVFDLFVQGEGQPRGAPGLGIGLSLARQLVEMHGGRINASSDGRGRGSTFTIEMPAIEVLEQERAAAPHVPPVMVARRVLIIDDNADAADTLASLVTALGGESATALSGEEGVQQAEAFRPDVVLLDIGMPGMDGYETCRRLRASPSGAGAFIVALTGWGQQSDKERALENGFNAHLTKPADPHTLETLLSEVSLPSASC